MPALNALYLLLGLAGLWLRPRLWPWMLAYMVLRSALLLHRGRARGALHAGVLPHAVCAGRGGAGLRGLSAGATPSIRSGERMRYRPESSGSVCTGLFVGLEA